MSAQETQSSDADAKQCPFCMEQFEIETAVEEEAFTAHVEECRFDNSQFGVGA